PIGPDGPRTPSGLPIRAPQTHGLLGPDPLGTPPSRSATARPPDAGPDLFGPAAALTPAPERQTVAPERIRGRLSRLYEGVHHARGVKGDP
ncbi:hypothetical protein UK99_05390, partial [Frankia casuarinae]